MTIFNVCTHAVATKQCNSFAKQLLPGNIIPHQWYKEFTDEHGNADIVAITILADIVAWYRNPNLLNSFYCHGADSPSFDGKALTLSYDYLHHKFSLGRERIRRAFVRLEQEHILSRKVCNVKLSDSRRVNRLVIILDDVFLNSCFRDSEFDIRVGESNIPSSQTLPNNEFFQPTSKCGDLIMKKNNNIFINKNRSNLSIFEKNFLKEKFEKKTNTRKNEFSVDKPYDNKKERKLADFYPLNDQDVLLLQNKSNREFSSRAMNEILQDMAKRLNDRVFVTKNAFLNYMSKAFKYEKRQAPLINNETFRIKNNMSQEEVEARDKETYLSEIEYSLQTSPEWHLRKKLAATLEQGSAYKVLKAWKEIRISGQIAKLYLAKEVLLTKAEERIIFKQVKATHEKLNQQTGLVSAIEKLEIIMPKERSINSFNTAELINDEPTLPNSVWGRVRKKLMEKYGNEIDRNWLSKLRAEICEEKKQLRLLAPSEFVKDWVESKYAYYIEKTLSAENYGVIIC